MLKTVAHMLKQKKLHITTIYGEIIITHITMTIYHKALSMGFLISSIITEIFIPQHNVNIDKPNNYTSKPHIKLNFALETEENNNINFLDIKITKTEIQYIRGLSHKS